jgi:hypothetical protein
MIDETTLKEYLGLMQTSVALENSYNDWKKSHPDGNPVIESLMADLGRLQDRTHDIIMQMGKN